MRTEGVNCQDRGGKVTIHSSGQTVFSFTHIEGITLGAGEEENEVAGGQVEWM